MSSSSFNLLTVARRCFSWFNIFTFSLLILSLSFFCSSVSDALFPLSFSFIRGQWPLGVSRSIKFSQYIFFLLHCVPLYVCRLCINFQELCARLLGMATLRIRFSPSFHALLIDFLSIRKVIIFSAIATDDRHPLRSRSIHQNAANCLTIRFRYIAQPRGVRKTYCARSRK